jgi:hypothetical protein
MVGAGQTGRRVTFVGLLALACGGRAEGVAPGDEADGDGEPRAPVLVVPERGGPTRLGGSGQTTPSATPTISPDAVQTFCYARDDLGPELEELLAILPRDALDDAGCLAAQYSSVLSPGGCVYDPSGAELSSGLCCYRLDTATETCSDPR